ncbi:serine hydroxymethyltransferase [Anaerococcus sp. Marseille-Q5996]|uniref:serine hydroxymethyltransferase n=1 Tax=Anaerococcus sp. Marseille-Q5996 TaxID=2972769 RepID=UPI0021C70545|nr:serine hydroxymethyltransferase [Anaerococcus sp. Marseille-Q5996]
MDYSLIKEFDIDLYQALEKEVHRQEDNIELIASENYVKPYILEAAGSVLTNKYAEGYPEKRYYGGCENIDTIEQIAIDRAKELFNCDHANVQPHSGSNANFAAYSALIKPGNKVLAMNLTEGGHLTHGSKVNFSGKIYDFYHYGVDNQTGRINYEEVLEKARQIRPQLIVCGASAYPREIDFSKFREIADEVGAILMADIAHIAGLIVAGEHPDPFPYCDVVTSTTHKTLRGPRSGIILCKEEFAKAIDKSVFPGSQGGPLEHIILAKALGFKQNLDPSWKEYAKNIKLNAKAMEEALRDYGFKMISDGTDNHLILIDLTNKNITGAEAQDLLDQVNITTNKNTIPNEQLSPQVTSGLRIGTAAITSRGMGVNESRKIIELISRTIDKSEDLEQIKREVLDLTNKFPVYGN